MKAARPANMRRAAPAEARTRPEAKLFSLAAGIWIGLSLLKFGNPIIFDQMIAAPASMAEFIFTSWPPGWGRILLGGLILAALPILKPRFTRADWPVAFLGFWLFWQFLSATRTVDPVLSKTTLIHFVTCALSFLLGWWALARSHAPGWFWTPVLAGLFYVLFNGFDQHHGGLEATRRAFFAQPDWQQYPKEYLLKMQSDRIFSTLVYPNTLAGVILLLLPTSLAFAWTLTARWPRVLRGVLAGLFLYLGLGCLYWTGSKGGWLVALGMAAVAFLHLEFPRKIKMVLVVLGLVLGLSAFFIRFSGYFQRGATSVSARFIYWQAAVETARTRPIFGSGPGTFSVMFSKLKPPDAEMARLTHNDYLEQASDSGIPGFIAFTGFILIALWKLYRPSWRGGWPIFLMWLGLAGWAAQALIEFSLYIPALAWPVFLFLGWLWGLSFSTEPQRSPINTD